ncbi:MULTISPECIES: PH domain-containing protein [Actinomadura]|uniref:Uncharacterized protein n=1 Tax=Actinomadura madurae TaxID=1993 RepID=A0A1I4ZLS7_9ACTN|nr:PH domain-containing protein [Actinomadura madurae]MCP9949129.1 PH domain-containing protein [Actinomadura madurae]MCP9965895.1 PH domain-containing protein [Actinomadura madurae]MCP9978371.1 PH domain-containing protein [Actinomadura madurae]MCQ0010108.1 PH domain-containing protein [Actinomadura madurae]MCQ0014579.1 PH domain-containing protein [Actinomadura madurae]
MVRAAEQALGKFVRRFETDDARRGKVAVVSTLIGLAGVGLSAPVLVAVFTRGETAYTIAGLLLGFSLVGLWWGFSCGRRYLMTPGEVFRVRVGGLAYEHAGRFRVIPWDRIRSVSERGQRHWVGEMLGWDVYSVVKIKGGDGHKGGRLLITGFTSDADVLVALIRHALEHGTAPLPPGSDAPHGAR